MQWIPFHGLDKLSCSPRWSFLQNFKKKNHASESQSVEHPHNSQSHSFQSRKLRKTFTGTIRTLSIQFSSARLNAPRLSVAFLSFVNFLERNCQLMLPISSYHWLLGARKDGMGEQSRAEQGDKRTTEVRRGAHCLKSYTTHECGDRVDDKNESQGCGLNHSYGSLRPSTVEFELHSLSLEFLQTTVLYCMYWSQSVLYTLY